MAGSSADRAAAGHQACHHRAAEDHRALSVRHNWSWGVVSRNLPHRALQMRPGQRRTITQDRRLPPPLVDKEGLESQGKTCIGREGAAALAEAGAHATLSGHVHDPFDIEHVVAGRTIRTIGAGTLSERTRATPPSFNELRRPDAPAPHVEHRMMGPTPWLSRSWPMTPPMRIPLSGSNWSPNLAAHPGRPAWPGGR
jgi:hypothetical protein